MTVLRSGSASDVGRVRTVNQDLPLERPNLYAVADGMGGHVGGEVAARVAVETLDQAFERAPTVDGLREAFTEANAAVWHESQANTDLRGMGTTLTAVALVGGAEGRDVLALANVGDSRAYVFSEGEMIQVTDDHSLAEERMRHGEMTEEEAAVHPQRHILTRALGVSAEVETDMWELELRDRRPAAPLLRRPDQRGGKRRDGRHPGRGRRPRGGGAATGRRGQRHGGADNITVVVVDVQVGEEGDAASSKVTPLGLGGPATRDVPQAPARPPSRWWQPATEVTTEVAHARGRARAGAQPGGPSDASDVTAVVPAVGQDETLAPGARLAFGDDPPRWRRRGRAATSSSWVTAASVPVARSTTRVPPPPGTRGTGRQAGRKGEPRRAPPAPGHPAPHHAAGDRIRPPGGRRAGRGLLRAASGTPTTTGS